jgi:hypothetical protein
VLDEVGVGNGVKQSGVDGIVQVRIHVVVEPKLLVSGKLCKELVL